jgi:cobalt-zinc-cadmium efflux system outer membrane protein
MRKIPLWAVLSLISIQAAAAQANNLSDSLTAERVVSLARARASQVRIAESQILEARGRLAGARALAQENPTIEGVTNADDRFERRTEWELNVPLGFGLGRTSRIGVARAELEREEQLAANARRGAVGEALAAYYRVLHAARRVELAKERHSVAKELQRTAQERNRAGEAPRLEVLLTETEEVRAESELLAEEQSLSRERISLARTLGLPSGERLAVAGELADRHLLTQTLASAGPERRADLLAAENELRASRASKGLARSDFLPGLAFRLNYGHEDGERLIQPGLGVTVPLFQFGQESRQAARARESRAKAELEATQNSVVAEVEGLEKVYAAATRAAEQLDARALPHIEESERMIRESYRAGKTDLPAMLFVRRDLLDTRREYLDRLLETALAGIDLAVAKGHFQR